MNKNFAIYFFIIIILILIFLFLYFNKKDTNNSIINESLYNFNVNDIPNFDNDLKIQKKDEKLNEKLNLKYENISQYKFKKLYETLAKINKGKISLEEKSNYNFYTQSTTDDKLRMDLDNISKYVLLILNSNNDYDFAKTNYGDVEVWIDKKGNEELKYELFLWDKKNYFEVKLLVYIIKFVDNSNIDSYGLRNSPYIFPDFNIGLPFKDQIIPLPTEVVITGNFDTGIDTIKPNEPSKIKSLYLNEITVQNSTLIVDYHKDKYPFNTLEVNEHGFSGLTDMSLEYVNIKNKSIDSPFIENARSYNKWITMDEEPKFAGQWPSNPPPRHWNEDGTYYYGKHTEDEITFNDNDQLKYSDKRLCDVYNNGTRWSLDKEELQPTFNPTVTGLPRNCSENNWLFELAGGNTTGNVFFGGGKR
jgi:hypothetical protein